MNQARRQQIFLSAAEREAGALVELAVDEQTVLVEVPAGTQLGAILRVRHQDKLLRVTVRERAWGIDGEASLEIAPRAGSLSGDDSFWQRAEEELVESYRSDKTLAGAVYVERHESVMILSGLTRRAVSDTKAFSLDSNWGAVLWTARPGLMANLSAFSQDYAAQARRLGRPIIHIGHTVLSPKSAATLMFPVGVRSLAVFAGLQGLLAIDQHRRGQTMLLGRALAARIVYPNGQIHPIGHSGASLPRELFDQAAFRADKSLGQVTKKASKFLQDFVQGAMAGQGPKR